VSLEQFREQFTMDRDIRIVVAIGTSVFLSIQQDTEVILIIYYILSLAQTLERHFQVFLAFSNLDLASLFK